MKIYQVYSVSATEDDCLMLDMDYTGIEGRRRAIVVYRAYDPYSLLTPIITQWLVDNNPEILPYVPPAPLTLEKLQAQMPDKSPREFRDILTDMGIFPRMVSEKINEIPFDIERQKALNAWEVSTYISRTDPYVDMIGAMFDKSPAEIDAAWMVL